MSNKEFQALQRTVWEEAFGKGDALILANDITDPDATVFYISKLDLLSYSPNVFPSSVQGICMHPEAQAQDPESLQSATPPHPSLWHSILTRSDVLSVKGNIAHIHPLLSIPTSAPFPGPHYVSSHWGIERSSFRLPRNRAWDEDLTKNNLRGEPRRPRSWVREWDREMKKTIEGVLSSSAEHWSSNPLESSEGQCRTCLRVIPPNRQGNWGFIHHSPPSSA